jgi:hypothetical protein
VAIVVRRLGEFGGSTVFTLLAACSSGGGAAPTDGGGGTVALVASARDASSAPSDGSGSSDGVSQSDAPGEGPMLDAPPADARGGGANDGNPGASLGSGTLDASITGSNADAGAESAMACDASLSTLTNGLVSWWRAEGNANDSVGTNNGVAENGVTYVARGGGQAFAFNGTMAEVQIPTSTTLDLTDGYTIAFWINLPSLPPQLTYIVEKLVSYAEDKAVDLNPDGTIGFHIFPVLHMEAPLNSTTALTLNAWHYVAATYDGAHAAIYLDGRLDSSTAVTGTIDNSTGSLGFAHNDTRDGGYLAGDLDEIRWYTRALSASEIAALASGCN